MRRWVCTSSYFEPVFTVSEAMGIYICDCVQVLLVYESFWQKLRILIMNTTERTWQTPQVEQLDLADTLGSNNPNSDGGGMANNAFPNPS